MTLPLVLHGVFPVIEETLAEPLEGEVGSVASILRMLETSCLRLFLKFERFSSLKKSGQSEVAVGIKSALARVCLRVFLESRALAIVMPRFGNRPFTIPGEFGVACILA
ncbi:MAG: hypothetical protein WCE79_15440 [Xanthobacteraceae bacterium]